MEAPATAPDPTPVSLLILPELLAALGVPADQVTPESVLNAIQAAIEKAGKSDALAATLAEVQGKLGTLEADAQTRLAAELDAELADYDLDEEALGVVKTLSPEQRKPLLGKLPKKAKEAPAEEVPAVAKAEVAKAAEPGQGLPPKAMHDPRGEAVKTSDGDKAAAADKLIASIRQGGKFSSYEAARNEARRQKPDLFQ